MNFIKAFRLDLGFTQDIMARELGMATSIYNRIERKAYPLSIRTAKKIIDVAELHGVKITLDDLFTSDHIDKVQQYNKIAKYAEALGVKINVEDLIKICE